MMNGVRDALNDLDRRTTPVASSKMGTASTTSTSWGDLSDGAGPAVTVVIGSTQKALTALSAHFSSTVSGGWCLMSYGITGASTWPPEDGKSLNFNPPNANNYFHMSIVVLEVALTPGSTTFTAKYRTASGTATFDSRRILVTPLGS